MKVTKLKVNNFQGLKGVHEFDFDKITALAQPNGSGKTSLINALRYGLTGVEPSGDMITIGEESTAVRVELENGSNFLRQKFTKKGKSSGYYVGNASTTLSKLNEFITHELGGVEISTAKTISSGELLANMNSQQFGEMLLQYLPESMSVDTILERFPSANQAQKEIIQECLPKSEFGVDKINEFHKLLMERRKIVKSHLTQRQAVLASLGTEPPQYTKEDLTKEMDALLQQRDEIARAQALFNQYEQIKAQIVARDNQIQQLEQELATLSGKEHTLEEQNMMQELLDNARTSEQTIQNAITSLIQSKKNLDLAIENISKPVCPLSDKIVCTVDKTPVLNELKEQQTNIVKDYQTQKEALLEIKRKIVELENRQKVMMEESNNYLRIQDKQKVKEQLLAQELVLPEKPENVGSMEEVTSKLNYLQQLLPVVENYGKRDKLEELIASLEKKYADYDELVIAFSPKGAVKEAITSYYMEEFSEPCNEKAKKLFPGMSLKFITEKGVKVLTDPNGSGEYLEFNSLSGGEKASVIFLLISMLASLSGMRIIILDELSVLDNQVFTNLIKVLKENEDEFDLCLLAAVDHDDTLKMLRQNHIRIIRIGGKDEEQYVEETVEEKAVEVVEEVEDEPKKVEDETSEEQSMPLDSFEEDDMELPFDESDEEYEEIEQAKKRIIPEEIDDELPFPATELDEKSETINQLKDLVNTTLDETKEKNFVHEEEAHNEEHEDEIVEVDENVIPLNKEALSKEEVLNKLGLSKGKSAQIVEYIVENIENDNEFYGTGKEIAEVLGISQPTVARIMKKLQEEELLVSVKRGVWTVADLLK